MRSSQFDNRKLISFFFGRKIIGLTRSGLTFYLAQSNQCPLFNEDQKRWQIKNGFQNPIWLFPVPGNVFKSTNIPVTFQVYINKILVEKFDVLVLYTLMTSLFILKTREKICGSYQISTKQVAKAFVYINLKNSQFD